MVYVLGQDLGSSAATSNASAPSTNTQPENGEPILNRGFQNWNYLVLNMIEWLKGGAPIAEFGMRGASER